VNCVTLLSRNVRYCALYVIGHPSLTEPVPPAVDTNSPFCVDVSLHQSINQLTYLLNATDSMFKTD